jgi:Fe-S cluster biogenesis protein NfuA
VSDDALPFEAVVERISSLAAELLDGADGEVAAKAAELLDWVDAFHREGLGRLVELVRAWGGEQILEAAATDPVAGTLLQAYGLGVDGDRPEAERAVQAALNEVRPYLRSHGGDVEVMAIVDGAVRLRMMGACDGCTGSLATIESVIDTALRTHWVDYRRLELEEMTAPAHPPPLSPSRPETVTSQVATGLQIRPKR